MLPFVAYRMYPISQLLDLLLAVVQMFLITPHFFILYKKLTIGRVIY